MSNENLIEKLEHYRDSKGYTKTYMASLLGCGSLGLYLTWIKRKSLPKKYYEAAREILRLEGDLTPGEREVVERLARLSPANRKVIEQLIDNLLTD